MNKYGRNYKKKSYMSISLLIIVMLIVSQKGNKTMYKIAVFDYENICTDLIKVCKVNEIDIQ